MADLNNRTGVIASRYFGDPSSDMTVIGITGTNGKTSVSYTLAQALSSDNKQCGLIGTLGYGTVNELNDSLTTTPDPVTLHHLLADMQDKCISDIVMEVSSHALDQHRIAGINFDLGIFTNLSRDHLDYHNDIESYANTKRRFFTDYSIHKVVINIDDEVGDSILNNLDESVEVVAYTLVEDLTDINHLKFPIVAGKINIHSTNGMTLDLKTPWGEGRLETKLLGEFNAYNLLACIATLCMLKMPFKEAVRCLSLCKSVPGRMECFREEKQPLIVVDYAHTPDALAHALKTLKNNCEGKLFCVFGCGGDRDKGKRILMGKVAQQYADEIILTNDNPRNEDPDIIIEDILSGINNENLVTVETDREAAINNAIHAAKENDIVLIAGKGHEGYQEIKGIRHDYSDQSVISRILERLQ